ncbi:MAG: hypothetical protein OXC28_17675 [Defluviicoccus sp.]|nr:hypothetical protein [Defluviicoccus sp.]
MRYGDYADSLSEFGWKIGAALCVTPSPFELGVRLWPEAIGRGRRAIE